MKMNAKALAPLALVAAFGLGTVAPHAQTTAQKVGFVDVPKVIAAHSTNKDITDISKKADAELAPLYKQVQDIDAKGAAATAADKDKRAQLVSTIQAKSNTYNTQLKPKVEAAQTAANNAIAAAAKANGYSIVMDRNVAASTGLVVYGEDSTDLTAAALKNLK